VISSLPFVTAADVAALLPPADAVAAIEAALLAGLDPGADPARTVVPLASGQLLLMPSQAPEAAGVKLVTIAPANPGRGLPRIQGVYLLLSADTLTPLALLDGTALTTLRTPAVSVAAVRPALLRDDAPLTVAVFGAGPQAVAHVATLHDVLRGRRRLARVTYLVRRDPDRAVPSIPDVATRLATAADHGQRAADEAGVVVCATTAREPLFDGRSLRDDAVVVAVGSHEPDAREVDGALAGWAHVVVEDVPTALREAGDVVQAVREGALAPGDLVPMRDVVTGRVTLAPGRPVLFKSTGMAWEDLVVAREIIDRRRALDAEA
jgi:ornithine cyclodeaminase/alanine dehydrogenase-like protein (mu-crystallin family)